MSKDYYKILGIQKDATTEEIKKAYKKLAIKYHPDKNKGNKFAEEKFKEINEAYEVLSSPQKKNNYDNFGSADFNNNFNTESFSKGFKNTSFHHFENFELFSNIFGSSTKGILKDKEITIKISLYDAYMGGKKSILTNNEKIEINIPKGTSATTQLRFNGKGNINPISGKRSNLIIKFEISSYKNFTLKERNLETKIRVYPWEIALGSEKIFETIEGKKIKIKIPKDTKNGEKLILKGLGMPALGNTVKGDLKVKLIVDVPKIINDEVKKIYERLKELYN
ncbi:J domain-containing protein [Borrelia miyamotoi]|uniref:DnaJ domain-containing protein n=1 Tax=Borrelia miyamotoi TaxID=47466 RepID=A0AAP9CFW1_9SPIR|nr:DnaJ C-terminal domain-containing protein [Borrelia miyamotoi]ATQ14599.1 DnaJ domain-containing protein [Borrelia miyamotoi]ATQ15784.1 DnaJ domain-containing protein [Borrelia miyamotoi]ATQ16928.1 DnaJ domain-containing protein [Borrelia miyamotoi]ATQ18567.1 DnaJ domain-containing protein [Borrelia miyamotoi]ATQ19423.1 DnaJ domain-containing protein [Borrelia miyamotoi]